MKSHLGQPLRVEIPLVGDDAGDLGAECFRVPAQGATSDDLPWVRDAITRVETTSSNRSRLIVSTRYAVQEPALMLGIQIHCGAQIRRDYTLLLGPAASIEAPRTLFAAEGGESAAPIRSPGRQRPVQTWQAVDGESAASIAAALAPGDRQAQRRIAREIVRANPTLYADTADAANAALTSGTTLVVPMAASSTPERASQAAAKRPAALATQNQAPASRPSSAAPATRKPPAPIATRADRLTVEADDGDRPLQQSLQLDDARRQAVPDDSTRTRLQREQQLILAIDDKIATTLELNERIRQLEAAQRALQAENARLSGRIDKQGLATPIAQPPTAMSADWRWIAAATALTLVAITAWLAWRRRRIQVLPVEPLPLAPVDGEAEEAEFDAEPLTASDIWPERESPPPFDTSARENIDWSPPTLSPGALGPSSLLHIDDEVEEHDSAVELAEIMMSFGRVQGAAETLAEFIRANPKQAVKPWIKLLEVYKAASMRMEFDALAGQLNKTFNVKAVTWDEFDQVKAANESLEQMQHVLNRVVQSWGTRDCQVLLHTLLRDNRKGTRQGFPLGVVDDILCLNGVLEIELGHFKATPAELLAMETPQAPQHMPPINIEAIADAPETVVTPEPAPAPAPEPAALADVFSFDSDLLPPSIPRAAAPEFQPERTESMIEFNLDEDLPPIKPQG